MTINSRVLSQRKTRVSQRLDQMRMDTKSQSSHRMRTQSRGKTLVMGQRRLIRVQQAQAQSNRLRLESKSRSTIKEPLPSR